MAILATCAILWIVLPVGIGVLTGALLAFSMHHSYRYLAKKTQRPVAAALVLTLGTSFGMAGALGLLGYLLVLQGVSVVASLPAYLASGGRADEMLQRVVGPLAPFDVHAETIVAHVRDALASLATSLGGWAAEAVAMVADAGLAVFFMATTMYFVLRNWSTLERRAERLMPINPHHTRRLMRELRRLGRSVVVGNFGTSLVQGLTAGFGFWLGHVPQAGFLGAMTGVLSLVPAFGTMLVWVPVGIVLIASNHPGWGTFELCWGALVVVGVCDYVVRPRLVGRGETMSMWMMFVALFGGIKLFGVIGLLLGPLFVGVALAALRLYERTRRFRLTLT